MKLMKNTLLTVSKMIAIGDLFSNEDRDRDPDLKFDQDRDWDRDPNFRDRGHDLCITRIKPLPDASLEM